MTQHRMRLCAPALRRLSSPALGSQLRFPRHSRSYPAPPRKTAPTIRAGRVLFVPPRSLPLGFIGCRHAQRQPRLLCCPPVFLEKFQRPLPRAKRRLQPRLPDPLSHGAHVFDCHRLHVLDTNVHRRRVNLVTRASSSAPVNCAPCRRRRPRPCLSRIPRQLAPAPPPPVCSDPLPRPPRANDRRRASSSSAPRPPEPAATSPKSPAL